MLYFLIVKVKKAQQDGNSLIGCSVVVVFDELIALLGQRQCHQFSLWLENEVLKPSAFNVFISRKYWIYLFVGLLCSTASIRADQHSLSVTNEPEITDLSLESLLDVEVTSVSKKAQPQSTAAAAIFVITNEDLRRSGVTNIPDALRMVPGINVASIDSNKWAITSRGFNGRFANKLQVLIDGRSVYTPSFSGVYWEMQDVPLEDVERIEVIRGPGATLWGANAVNGVINVITKHAADTQGGLLTLGAGTLERGFGSFRYGTNLGESTYGRAYFKGFKRGEFVRATGQGAGDDWNMLRGGFRVDSQPSNRDALTIQGDLYQGNINQVLDLPTLTAPFSQIVRDDASVWGGNLITRWQHTLSPTSEFSLQVYYDRFDRDEVVGREVTNTLDIDFLHRFAIGQRHDIIWGLGYRYLHDKITPTTDQQFDPPARGLNLFSAVVQDEITLVENRLWLTLGSKFEHNDYTGFEIQPTARLFWAPHPQHKFWASVSRAVRTPSRAEREATVLSNVLPPFSPTNPSPFPVALEISGDPEYGSEELLAYELGYRVVPIRSLSLDLTAFYNDYDDLRSTEPNPPMFQGTHVVQTVLFGNQLKGRTYGLELAAVWQATDWWRWDLAYSFLKTDFDNLGEGDTNQNSDGPENQVSLRSVMNLRNNVDMDLWLRYVDEVTVINARSPLPIEIGGYITLDARLAWKPIKKVELSLVGQNLLNARHLEYVQESFTLPTEVPRSVYAKVTWRF